VNICIYILCNDEGLARIDRSTGSRVKSLFRNMNFTFFECLIYCLMANFCYFNAKIGFWRRNILEMSWCFYINWRRMLLEIVFTF
jgi:hypothetical protein